MSTMASLCIIRLLWKKYRETKPSIGRHDDGPMEAIFWMPFESQHKSHISAWRTHVLEWEKKVVTWCGSTNHIFNSTTMHSYACLLVTKKIWRQIVGNKMKRKVIMRNWRENAWFALAHCTILQRKPELKIITSAVCISSQCPRRDKIFVSNAITWSVPNNYFPWFSSFLDGDYRIL